MKLWPWIVGGVAALGALIGIGVYEEKKSSGGGGGTPPTTTTKLQSGHRYELVLTCPQGTVLPLPKPPVPDPAVVALLAIPNISVVPGSFIVSPGGNGFAVSFDYSGPTMQLPPIQLSGATACSTNLVDKGPSFPIKGGVPQGGFGGHGFNPPQQVSLQAGQVASAGNVSGGAVSVTTTGTITGVNGAPVKSWSPGSSSNQATIVLSGTAGSINVTWMAGPSQPVGATIKVS